MLQAREEKAPLINAAMRGDRLETGNLDSQNASSSARR
jgi:hypothetical protein